ncbi:MAG: MFS transporter [candidate division Zixibacteria bacterium]|nr:MFS transporter [candidate division Zixibacteria bacterium]
MLAYFKKFDHRLWILSLGWFSSAVGFSLSLPFISIYFHSELGISLTGIGLFFGISAVIRTFFQTMGGELSDRLGRYYVMVIAQSVRAVLFLVIAYVMSSGAGFIPIAALLIFNSIFGASFQPAANATVADVVDSKFRTEGYAIVRAAANLGWAAGPALGGYMAGMSYSVLFVMSGVMALVSSSIIAIFLRDIRHKQSRRDSFRMRDVFAIRKDRNMLRHIVLVFMIYLVVAQLIAPLSLYAVELRGLTEGQLGFLYTINGLMVASLQIPVTRLLRPLRYSSQLALGAAIYGIGYFCVGMSSTFPLFLLAIIIITTGENCISPPALSITANLAPTGYIGRYMGVYGFAVSGGWSLGPLLGGTLLDWAKPDFMYAWGIVVVLALITAIGFLRQSGRIPKEFNLYRQ